MSSLFETFDTVDVLDLIQQYPLAWITTSRSPASLLPLLIERGADGCVSALIGHMARRNPLFEALGMHPRAVILFQGPQGYISPGCVSDRQWAPTWNYAQLQIEADVSFDPRGGNEAIAALLDAMEGSLPNRWDVAEMGERYRAMEQSIIAFRADISVLRGRFKLGQDERPEILAEIIEAHRGTALADWMRRMNRGRLIDREVQ